MQGFLVGRPRPIDEYAALVSYPASKQHGMVAKGRYGKPVSAGCWPSGLPALQQILELALERFQRGALCRSQERRGPPDLIRAVLRLGGRDRFFQDFIATQVFQVRLPMRRMGRQSN
jgi:hypothetical protein